MCFFQYMFPYSQLSSKQKDLYICFSGDSTPALLISRSGIILGYIGHQCESYRFWIIDVWPISFQTVQLKSGKSNVRMHYFDLVNHGCVIAHAQIGPCETLKWEHRIAGKNGSMQHLQFNLYILCCKECLHNKQLSHSHIWI